MSLVELLKQLQITNVSQIDILFAAANSNILVSILELLIYNPSRELGSISMQLQASIGLFKVIVDVGFESTALHYIVGIAAWRLRKYKFAEIAFKRCLISPKKPGVECNLDMAILDEEYKQLMTEHKNSLAKLVGIPHISSVQDGKWETAPVSILIGCGAKAEKALREVNVLNVKDLADLSTSETPKERFPMKLKAAAEKIKYYECCSYESNFEHALQTIISTVSPAELAGIPALRVGTWNIRAAKRIQFTHKDIVSTVARKLRNILQSVLETEIDIIALQELPGSDMDDPENCIAETFFSDWLPQGWSFYSLPCDTESYGFLINEATIQRVDVSTASDGHLSMYHFPSNPCTVYSLAECLLEKFNRHCIQKSGSTKSLAVEAAEALLDMRDIGVGFKRPPMIMLCTTAGNKFSSTLQPLLAICNIHAKSADSKGTRQTRMECKQLALVHALVSSDCSGLQVIFAGDFNLAPARLRLQDFSVATDPHDAWEHMEGMGFKAAFTQGCTNIDDLCAGGGKLYDNIWLSSSLSTGLRSSTARVEAPAMVQEIIDMGGSQHAYFHAYSDHKLLWVDIDLAQCHEEPVSQDSLAQSMSPLLLWAKSQITP